MRHGPLGVSPGLWGLLTSSALAHLNFRLPILPKLISDGQSSVSSNTYSENKLCGGGSENGSGQPGAIQNPCSQVFNTVSNASEDPLESTDSPHISHKAGWWE